MFLGYYIDTIFSCAKAIHDDVQAQGFYTETQWRLLHKVRLLTFQLPLSEFPSPSVMKAILVPDNWSETPTHLEMISGDTSPAQY